MDAVAENRRLQRKHALSIQWGIWQDIGLVKGEAGERNVSELARHGVRAFTPEQGAALFTGLIRTPHPSAAVLPIDWSTFLKTRGGRRRGLFDDVFVQAAADGRDAPGTATSLAQADPAKRRQALQSIVRDAVTQVLKIPPSRVDPRKALGEMGLNSLLAMELRNRLELALSRPLSATLAWNYPTVEALVQHLAGDQPQPSSAVPDDGAAPGGAEALRSVNELSDEEAALALRSRT
jgi:myxalamid-type polyketide synthase MxaE and MxaD